MTSIDRSAVATGRPHVASVAKAAAILQSFSPLTTTLSVRQLADRTGVPRSTVHALCATLCRSGLLELVDGRGYQLGPALVTLGGHVIDRTGLVAAAEQPLRRVRLDEGHEVHLGQLVDSWIVYLDRRSGPEAVPMRNRVGLRALAHRTGCGKAALAAMPVAQRHAVIRDGCARDRVPMPDLQHLDAELHGAAVAGYVVSGVFHPGRTSVAAAIIDGVGHPVGGVSVAAASDSLDAAATRRIGRRVRYLATAISRRLVDGSRLID